MTNHELIGILQTLAAVAQDGVEYQNRRGVEPNALRAYSEGQRDAFEIILQLLRDEELELLVGEEEEGTWSNQSQ